MKIVFKILKISLILILTLSVILFATARVMQDKVADIVLKSLNKNISTKLHISAFRLSFLSKFPKASLELKDVLVHSSPNFNSGAFPGINTDTLLSAKNVSIEFKITDLLRGKYIAERIRARTGMMNFFTDTEGRVNYDISTSSEKAGSNDLTIDLEKIYVSDIRSCYNNVATKLTINGVIRKGTLKSKIHGNNVSFNAEGELQIDSLQLYSSRINKKIIADVDIDLQKTKSGISFKKGSLHIDNYDFGLDGFISSDNIYDLKITGHNIDISRIRNYLPDKYLVMLSDYDLRGILAIDSRIKGVMTRTNNPHTETIFRLDRGRITYGKSDLAISNLSFDGIYSNGSKNSPATGILRIKDFRANLGSAEYHGSFSMSGFNDPFAELNLKGKVIPAEITEFFGLKNISETGGSIEFDLKFSGKVDLKNKFALSDIIDLETEGNIGFNSFTIGLNNNRLLVNDVMGSLLITNTILAKNLKFSRTLKKSFRRLTFLATSGFQV